MNIDESTIKSWEEHAFYECGLCSHGCMEKFGDFEFAALEKYGRILLKFQESYFRDEDNYLKEFGGETIISNKQEQDLLDSKIQFTYNPTIKDWESLEKIK